MLYLKLTVLGRWGAYPEANEATAGYLIQVNNKNILIDCGSGVLASLQNHIKLEDLDIVIISHFHADHMCDIYPLQYAMNILIETGKRKAPLDIYANAKSKDFKTLNYKKYCFAKKIEENKEMNIEDIIFSFKKTRHQEACYSVKIENNSRILCYTGDTGYKDELAEFFANSDLLISESSLYDEQKGMNIGHLTASEAGRFAQISNSKKLLLSHLPHFGDLNNMIIQAKKEFDGEVILALQGMKIEL